MKTIKEYLGAAILIAQVWINKTGKDRVIAFAVGFVVGAILTGFIS